ncbi:hypothetical protein [Microbulbifer sp. JSM ZJ756]|uniref:hypothetical protein n=1 Tax=Microbulbifer sp. JSM ZJ756 TaxID=3376191 RepID=UPI0037B739BC
MSNMIEYIAATVNNAGPDEFFYQLTSGIFSGDIVRITQTELEIDLDDDGTADQLNFKHVGTFVDVDNNERTNAAGVAWRTKAEIHSLMIDAIAAGTVDKEVSKGNWRADWVQQTAQRRVAIGE